MVLIFILQSMLWVTTNQVECENFTCSHVYDPLCGLVESAEGVHVLTQFHNLCYFNKIKCNLRFTTLNIHQVDDYLCNIQSESRMNGRRGADFSVVGAVQVCNHTCPTFCTDAYDPVCAKIWKKNNTDTSMKTMINHCHVDMFSCAFGLNVTIESMSLCLRNPDALLFMKHIANLNNLKILDTGSMEKSKVAIYPEVFSPRRKWRRNLDSKFGIVVNN